MFTLACVCVCVCVCVVCVCNFLLSPNVCTNLHPSEGLFFFFFFQNKGGGQEGPGAKADLGFQMCLHPPFHQLLTSLSPPPPSLQEFVHLAKRLVSDPALEKKIVANGREYVRKYHSWQEERQTYRQLVRMLERNTGTKSTCLML